MVAAAPGAAREAAAKVASAAAAAIYCCLVHAVAVAAETAALNAGVFAHGHDLRTAVNEAGDHRMT